MHLAHDGAIAFVLVVVSCRLHGRSLVGLAPLAPHVDQPVLWIPHEAQHGVDRGVGIRPIKVHRGHEALDVVDGGMDASGVVAMGGGDRNLGDLLVDDSGGVDAPVFCGEGAESRPTVRALRRGAWSGGWVERDDVEHRLETHHPRWVRA